MENISVFDMLKIGVGPSSSHTLGPWRAAERFIKELKELNIFDKCSNIKIDLYGSLSLTGMGHATDIAVTLGLTGADPETVDTNKIEENIELIKSFKRLHLNSEYYIDFNFEKNIVFNKSFLDFHSNALTFTATINDSEDYKSTFYSIGGGFIIKEEDSDNKDKSDEHTLPFPIEKASDLIEYTIEKDKQISEIVLENEKSWREESDINKELDRIWSTMLDSLYTGVHSKGYLPGGLNVRRRAYDIHTKLLGDSKYENKEQWLEVLKSINPSFRDIFKWISCFALSVNEVNAALGRIVTAPTNGSSGVIPAVLLYYICFVNNKDTQKDIRQFLLVAGEIGCLFKKGATISAAMGGCQAEIGVSSAMAAAALTELLGGSVDQVTNAAEIAMEHHLGLTCDPIGGLVQIPCIERNSMGAIKAINAAELALETKASHSRVNLDEVINTMWETAKDMNIKYKETSEGGLAIAVNIANC
ncbi:MAG: L-serine ammonia-lyase [Flavobacteriaceae bacterium]|nr:L-serine ammonia-lyase [Flavobacteriaceae bacterium]